MLAHMDTQKQGNTEQAIMAAAEELFLEKGYHLATTTMIARKAGVTHAMLHYYFRTKEQIFGQVLDKYINEIIASFQPVMQKEAPFWDTMEKGIATHFDFLAKHPLLPALIFDVVRFNPELLESYKDYFCKTIGKVIEFHCSMIQAEIDKGNIRKVEPIQLLMDIVMLNVSTFMLLNVAEKLTNTDEETTQKLLQSRKNEIITLIKFRLYSN